MDILLARLHQLRPVAEYQQRIPIHRQVVFLIVGVSCVLLLSALLLTQLYGYHGLFAELNGWGARLPGQIWAAITLLGDTRVALAFLLIFVYRNPQILPATLFAAVPVTLVIHFFKNFYQLERPAAVLNVDSFNLIGKALKAGSFPSGHSATIGVIAALLILISRYGFQRVVVIVLMLVVAVSRVMVGAHWPVDTFVGSAIGLLFGLMGYWLSTRYQLLRGRVSQWLLVALLLVAAYTTFFNNGGYPSGHYFAMAIALVALISYHFHLLSQLRQPSSQ